MTTRIPAPTETPVVRESDTIAKTAAQTMATRPRVRKRCRVLASWSEEVASVVLISTSVAAGGV
jgi:hypothetical protein